ncbi:MAG: hypothetical protein IKD97_01660, partial [Firmicutes bacterium]|nr:hypothetical protein [Bacillota bacterium]
MKAVKTFDIFGICSYKQFFIRNAFHRVAFQLIVELFQEFRIICYYTFYVSFDELVWLVGL